MTGVFVILFFSLLMILKLCDAENQGYPGLCVSIDGRANDTWCETNCYSAKQFLLNPHCDESVSNITSRICKCLPSFGPVSEILRNSHLRRRILLVIPLNAAHYQIGINTWCSLQKAVQGGPIMFMALDVMVYKRLMSHDIPVYMDPFIPPMTSDEHYCGTAMYNHLTCAKLSAVLHLFASGDICNPRRYRFIFFC